MHGRSLGTRLVSYEYSHALNGLKEAQIAYLAAISYLDKLGQSSYTLSTQIRAKTTPRACLATLAQSSNSDYATALAVN